MRRRRMLRMKMRGDVVWVVFCVVVCEGEVRVKCVCPQRCVRSQRTEEAGGRCMVIQGGCLRPGSEGMGTVGGYLWQHQPKLVAWRWCSR